MTTINDLVWYFSGGTGNSDGRLSLGGALGEPVKSFNFTIQSGNSISGLSIVKGFGFQDNEVITITYDSVNDTVTISSNTFYAQQIITSDGFYTFTSGNNYLIINVTYSQMNQSTITEVTYNAELIFQNVYDDVLPLEATNGRTDYRVLYLYNEGGTDATNVTFFVNQPAGGDTIYIQVGSINTDIIAVVNETDDPLNVGFYQFTTNDMDGINIGTLQAGQYIPVILQRFIPSNVSNKVSNQLNIVVGTD